MAVELDPIDKALLDQVFQYHGLDRRPHWTDDATRNIPMHFSYAFTAYARATGMSGNQAEMNRAAQLAEAYAQLAER